VTFDHETDVLVVGSGPGGAVTAAVLAEAGLDVLVAEDGDWVPQGTCAPFSLDQMERQYRNAGLTVALGLPSIAYTEGRGAGGGSEVNSGMYHRPSAELLARWRDRWSIADLRDSDVHPWSAEVEQALAVAPLAHPAPEASRVLADGARARGWRAVEAPRWLSFPCGGPGRRHSMTETYLPRAVQAGAQLLTGLRIDRLRFAGRRAVWADGHLDGRPVRIGFRRVFVCGGAIQTPALLQRSGLRRRIGATLSVHPTVKATAFFDHPVNDPGDVAVHQVKEFAPELSFGGSASRPGLVALALADDWPASGARVADWERASVYYAAIQSQGRGRALAVPGVSEPLVTYRLTHTDRRRLTSGLCRLTHLLLAAGAESVIASAKGVGPVRTDADVADLADAFATSRASIMTVHLCSTVPLGERVDCPADSHGRVKAADNVLVNDASLLPEAPGVNPQGTIMALTHRNCARFLDTEG